MTKDKAQEYIHAHLDKDDSLIGFFQAMEPMKIWLFFIIGPLAAFSMKQYILAVTKKGIYFHKLNMFGKFASDDFFKFDEIASVKIGKGLMQRPMTFKFKNSRKLTVKAQLKGIEKVPKLTDNIQQHIERNIPLER